MFGVADKVSNDMTRQAMTERHEVPPDSCEVSHHVQDSALLL